MLFGYRNNSEIKGKNVKILIPKSISENHDNYLTSFLKKGSSTFIYRTTQLVGRHKNEKIFILYLTIKPFFDEKTKILKLLSHFKVSKSDLNYSIIFVDEIGIVDSVGGEIFEILSNFRSKLRFNIIYILIYKLCLKILFKLSPLFYNKYLKI